MSAVERQELIRELYAAFNARDIETAVGSMIDGVDWPNAWEGGRVRGHEGVRDYWSRQWSSIDSRVEPLSFESRADGSLAVEVQQSARDLDGNLLSEGRVVHVYVFRGDLVVRMDVEEPPA